MNKKKYFIVLSVIFLSIFVLNPQIIKNYNAPAFASECECAADADETASGHDKDKILYDIYGRQVDFRNIPRSVVSLVPAVTEMIEAVNPDCRLKGVTTHDSDMQVSDNAEIVGGFRNPDTERIKSLKPEIIFASSLHKSVHSSYKNNDTHVIILKANNAKDIYRNIEIIGRLYHKEDNAKTVIENIRSKIVNIQHKIKIVPQNIRVRAMRLMGFDGKTLWIPGDDSFQTEAVRLAGGIPIKTGKKGQIVPLTLQEWKKFNPQFVYSCGDSEKMRKDLGSLTGWKDVSAVKNNQHKIFNCNLTCRPSVNYGAFIEYLSACLYGDHYFSSPPLKKDKTVKEKKIEIDIPYIKKVSVQYGSIDDFEHKTLVIELKKKYKILSTLTGLQNADIVGNHYLSPPRWNDGHTTSLEAQEKKICNAVNAAFDSSAFLITGADMDNLAVVMKKYKNFKTYALVTAGVMGNAQRQSKDEGLYYPYGTINMIILANAQLSGGAMARAVITATEAKTAALQDMDIRSTYTPLANQATGTGTDNIIVVSGDGLPVDSTGGHTKMGELIGKAVYEAVIKAAGMQNKVKASRTIFRRLKERKIYPNKLASSAVKHISLNKTNELTACMENALNDKKIAGFLETAFAASDAYKNNLINDTSHFYKWSISIAEKISGKKISELIQLNIDKDKNSPLNIALSGLLTGAVYRIK